MLDKNIKIDTNEQAKKNKYPGLLVSSYTKVIKYPLYSPTYSTIRYVNSGKETNETNEISEDGDKICGHHEMSLSKGKFRWKHYFSTVEEKIASYGIVCPV